MKKNAKKALSASSVTEGDAVSQCDALPAEPAEQLTCEDAPIRAGGARLEQASAAVVEANLSVRLSASLLEKLRRCAEEEGLSVEAFASELISEGVVLRAWEIMQRHAAMRGQTPAPGQAQAPGFRGGNHAGSYQPRHSNHSKGNGHGNGNYAGNYNNQNRSPRGNNNAWMEDKAAFLEYVRNQEKRRR